MAAEPTAGLRAGLTAALLVAAGLPGGCGFLGADDSVTAEIDGRGGEITRYAETRRAALDDGIRYSWRPRFGAADESMRVMPGDRQGGLPLPAHLERKGAVEAAIAAAVPAEEAAEIIAAASGLPTRLIAEAVTPEGQTVRVAVTGGRAIAHSGPLSALLDRIAGEYDLTWRWDGRQIRLLALDTETWTLPVPLGGTQLSSGAGGLSGGGAARQVTLSSSTEQNPWNGLRAQLAAAVRPPALVTPIPEAGQVMVTGRPSDIEAAQGVIDHWNEIYAKRITLEVGIYEVSAGRMKEFQAGLGIGQPDRDEDIGNQFALASAEAGLAAARTALTAALGADRDSADRLRAAESGEAAARRTAEAGRAAELAAERELAAAKAAARRQAQAGGGDDARFNISDDPSVANAQDRLDLRKKEREAADKRLDEAAERLGEAVKARDERQKEATEAAGAVSGKEAELAKARSLAAPNRITSDGNGVRIVDIISGRRFQLDFRAVADNSSVLSYRTASTVAMSGTAAPIILTRNRAYLKSRSAGSAEGSGEGAEPDEYDVGLTLHLMPRLIRSGGDDRIQLSIVLMQNNGIALRSFGGIQLPEIEQRMFSSQLLMRSGETLLLSGYETEESEAGGGGGLLSVNTSRSSGKRALVVLVRPALSEV